MDLPRMKARFALAYAALVLVAAAALGTAYLAYAAGPRPHHQRTPGSAIDEADWGHVRATNSMFQFVLGAAADQRARYELGLERQMFDAARLAVADDEHGTNLTRLVGGPTASGCLARFEGAGTSVVIAIGKCVPKWATVSGDPGRHRPAEWIRVENARSAPVVVFIEYSPLAPLA